MPRRDTQQAKRREVGQKTMRICIEIAGLKTIPGRTVVHNPGNFRDLTHLKQAVRAFDTQSERPISSLLNCCGSPNACVRRSGATVLLRSGFGFFFQQAVNGATQKLDLSLIIDFQSHETPIAGEIRD